ncbi:hypothetical protein [Streptomyces sp. NPDC018036]|uniref:hypothetical protein n=1 Tax=Streptomyces sp. NPDC018036 TaxID=3365035 RepID=UPI00379CCC6C
MRKLARTGRLAAVVAGVQELEQYVAGCAGDDRGQQHACHGIGDSRLDGEADCGSYAVGREGCSDQPSSFRTVLRRHLNSRLWGLV